MSSQNGQTSQRTGQQIAGVSEQVRAIEDLPVAIAAYAADYPAGHDTGTHAHTKAQLVHAEAGVMTVRGADGSWVVPTNFAVWIPAGVEHRVRAATAIRMRSLYVAASEDDLIPSDCRVVAVTPLLRELIHRAAEMSNPFAPDGPEARLVAVLRDELGSLKEAPLNLPMPRDARALTVAEHLIDRPDDNSSLEEWARDAGASDRTLARLFLKETGLSFGQWRQRRRLLAALERLGAGETVTTVALDLGYASPSAFTAMFRRQLGSPPSGYLGERAG